MEIKKENIDKLLSQLIIAENGIFFNPIFNFETRCCIDCGQDIETFKSLVLEKL